MIRKDAEEIYRKRALKEDDILKSCDPLKFEEILYELRVHQIELEMQNEELQRIHKALEISKERYYDLYDQAPVGYLVISEKGIILESNLTALKILDEDHNKLINRRVTEYIDKADQDTYYYIRKKLFETKQPQKFEIRMKSEQKEPFWVNIQASISAANYIARDNQKKEISTFRFVITDITELKNMGNSLKENEECYRHLFEYSGVGIAYYTIEGKIIFYNKKAAENMGGKPEDFVGKSLFELFPYDQAYLYTKRIERAANSDIEHEYEEYVTLNNEKRYYFSIFNKILNTNGDLSGVQIISQDITERKKTEDQIRYLSYHDSLTDLFNRRYFEEMLAIINTQENLPISIVMGDVNGLKLINDSFGHSVGDEMLRKAANAIKSQCRESDIAARLGGDEFVIILPKTSREQAEQIVKLIRENLAKEKAGSLDISITFGYETKYLIHENIQNIFKDTEDHMYRYKLTESSSMRSSTIDLIINTLYEKNHREMLHSKRVSNICGEIANLLNLDTDTVNQLKIAGLMHDIGKIGIDENILNGTRILNNYEKDEIKKHSEIGYRILSSVNEFSEIAKIVLQHHERYDGKGYPNGLKGEEISLQGRIIGIADAFDAMTSERTYKTKLTIKEALDEIVSCAGTQFDPEITQIFVASYTPNM